MLNADIVYFFQLPIHLYKVIYRSIKRRSLNHRPRKYPPQYVHINQRDTAPSSLAVTLFYVLLHLRVLIAYHLRSLSCLLLQREKSAELDQEYLSRCP